MISKRSGCPVSTWYWRASLSADSTASLPPQVKKTAPPSKAGSGELEDLGGEALGDLAGELAGMHKRQLPRLRGHGIGDGVDTEADEVNGRAAGEVDVFTSVGVPDAGTFGAGGNGVLLGEGAGQDGANGHGRDYRLRG